MCAVSSEQPFDFKNFLSFKPKIVGIKGTVEMVIRVFIFHLKVIRVNLSNLPKTILRFDSRFEANKTNLKLQSFPYFEHTCVMPSTRTPYNRGPPYTNDSFIFSIRHKLKLK